MSAKKVSPFEKVLAGIDENIFNGQLTDIIEVTYAYKKMADGNYWNETLFGYFAGFRFDQGISMKTVSHITNKKLEEKIRLINKYLERLKNIDYVHKSEKIRAKILQGSLEYSRTCLEMALTGLVFELSKAGHHHSLSNKEVEKKIKKIEKLEKKNFGGKISCNPNEVCLAYNYILKAFKEGRNELTLEEQKLFKKKYIFAFKTLLDPTKEAIRVKYYSKTKLPEDAEKKLSKKITRKEYSKIFSIILNDILGLNFKIVHEERSSIYDGPGVLAIPSAKYYNSLTLRRVIELIGHEIEVHCFNYRMNQELIGNFRGAGNLEKEEGFAMTVEEFLKGRKLEDITVTRHFVIVLATEIFNLNELEEFMKLYSKLTGRKYSFESILRQKRNYPLDLQGGQHKDVTYGRGIQKVLDFLRNGGDMRELYLGKISLSDISKAKTLLKYEGKTLSDLNIPIFFGELLLYLVITPSEKSNCDHFINYLKKKYHFINFDNLDLLIMKEFVRVKVSFSSLGLV